MIKRSFGMTLIEDIQAAMKANNAILGYKKSLEYLRNNSPKTIVIANNLQAIEKREIEHDANISGTSIEIFDGSSKELGVVCGKPFPISALVIKK
jgi:large subunit ribosomal protein L30e